MVREGDRFGSVEAVRLVGMGANYHRIWSAKCDCGRTWELNESNLKKMKSCGCQRKPYVLHGQSSDRSPAYISWCGIIARCYSPNDDHFHDYGGRGIRVCERWRVFVNFYADMGDRPDGMTLDRLDTNGNYEPDNCRWATPKQQARNRRKTHKVVFQGREMALMDAVEMAGIKPYTVRNRMKRHPIQVAFDSALRVSGVTQ